MVFLRAGGHSIRQTYDMDIVIVGDKERNPADKFTYVSKKFVTSTEDVHFRYTKEMHIFMAEKKILLMAGRSCPPAPPENEDDPEGCAGPCLYNVIVARCPWRCPLTQKLHWSEKSISEVVFASALHSCDGESQAGCGGNRVDDDNYGGCGSYHEAMSQAASSCDSQEDTIDTGAGTVGLEQPQTPGTQTQPVANP